LTITIRVLAALVGVISVSKAASAVPSLEVGIVSSLGICVVPDAIANDIELTT
jgi:hypothetical protein